MLKSTKWKAHFTLFTLFTKVKSHRRQIGQIAVTLLDSIKKCPQRLYDNLKIDQQVDKLFAINVVSFETVVSALPT